MVKYAATVPTLTFRLSESEFTKKQFGKNAAGREAELAVAALVHSITNEM